MLIKSAIKSKDYLFRKLTKGSEEIAVCKCNFLSSCIITIFNDCVLEGVISHKYLNHQNKH